MFGFAVPVWEVLGPRGDRAKPALTAAADAAADADEPTTDAAADPDEPTTDAAAADAGEPVPTTADKSEKEADESDGNPGT